MSELDQALTGGQPHRVGQFRFYFDSESWVWSDEVQQMHGYSPGGMPHPTTAPVLAHKHPDDRDRVLSMLELSRHEETAFSTRHRMIDMAGVEHEVMVVGSLLRDADGRAIGTEGFYIDITAATDQQDQRLDQVVEDFSSNRAVIEQAKGMLMLLYGLSEDAAFEILRWRSQTTNSKLRVLAERLVRDNQALGGDELPRRATYDNILMTVHERLDETD